MVEVRVAYSIRHQAAVLDELLGGIDCRQPMLGRKLQDRSLIGLYDRVDRYDQRASALRRRGGECGSDVLRLSHIEKLAFGAQCPAPRARLPSSAAQS